MPFLVSSSIPVRDLKVSKTYKMFGMLALLFELLLRVTVTVGDEERVSSLGMPPQLSKYPRHTVNVTDSFVLRVTSTTAVVMAAFPTSLPLYPREYEQVLVPSPRALEQHDRYVMNQQQGRDQTLTSLELPLQTEQQKGLQMLQGTNGSSGSTRRISRKKFCSSTTALDNCLGHIPPIPDIGIPSSSNAVESACRAFNMGMSCVDDWMEKCIKKQNQAKLKASISGAHETFTFLCRDYKFRAEFLKHGDCYKRISYQWDECSRHFIENLKRYSTPDNATVQCCVRLMFLQCVTEISHIHCSRDAAMFLQRMAETLVRATMRTHVPPQCVSIQHRNCSMVNSSPSWISSSSLFYSEDKLISLLHLQSLGTPSYALHFLFSLLIYFFSSSI